ncbi:hypothetical protein RHVP.24 [Cricetid gammaherpesvirus 2]|uniref:Herpesvirus UL87 C-terminal domain-containing protein n=1 Tax=Cricetid gammaherpesvirus 2 TaxID=1605972 RepID=E9M5K7_9GAMA|nr:hypothetical protein RHVP.24 [Cricetid gammaherpesvirus 2]ADW24365.1 hypothetical protein RHVP.24 [Cricetid gammaherpesvirus 2]ADW24447.1 hypothetical protein RHVP-L.24 [Cricetid gammaherpesvirus 2]
METLLPVFCDLPDQESPVKAVPEKQLSLLYWLCSNSFTHVSDIAQFFTLGQEITFCLCRAIRRLLLGEKLYPLIYHNNQQKSIQGPTFTGPGLSISSNGSQFCTITTNWFLPVVYSFEITDSQCEDLQHRKLRAIHSPLLFDTGLDYNYMFYTIIKFLSMKDIDDCYSSFLATLEPWIHERCKKNYMKLIAGIMGSPLTKLPSISLKCYCENLKFSISSYIKTWMSRPQLSQLLKTINKNMEDHAHVATVVKLCRFRDLDVQTDLILNDHQLLTRVIPGLNVDLVKKQPGANCLRLTIHCKDGCKMWLRYPPNLNIVRTVMCMAYVDHISYSNSLDSAIYEVTHNKPGMCDVFVSMFKRIDYAPKDSLRSDMFDILNKCYPRHVGHTSNAEIFKPQHHLSLEGFKITVFNTNMVINTKIATRNVTPRYKMITDVPRLTNNFVVKKYSFKEPSFTISVFFSEDMRKSAAININISGPLLHFLFAMTSLKCFLPILTINLATVSNWNSTFDLQGLENQSIVRAGRQDVFWTTNFPSVVSTKRGYNISWFKAATATVSKIHGPALVKQVTSEAFQILKHPQADINYLKNTVFTTLENRNKYQIQTLHKRFLECLFESCKLYKTSPSILKRLVARGIFDFSRRIISHTKNKHECALAGYRRCNMVPKILTGSKKCRLDELGRNSNFWTFMKTDTDSQKPST